MLAAQCTIQRKADICAAVGQGRARMSALGFNRVDCTRIDSVITELARDLLVRADGGQIPIDTLDQNDRHSSVCTLSVSLAGAKRLIIRSTISVGTQARAIAWLSPTRNLTSMSEGKR